MVLLWTKAASFNTRTFEGGIVLRIFGADGGNDLTRDKLKGGLRSFRRRRPQEVPRQPFIPVDSDP
jgi:hypothetical protein